MRSSWYLLLLSVSHLVRTEKAHNSSLVLEKRARAPRYCGTWTLKCKGAEEACSNACFYHNCLTNGNGQWGANTGGAHGPYQDGGRVVGTPNPHPRTRNRALSGAIAKGSTVCRSLPISQKLFDTYVPDDFGWTQAISANPPDLSSDSDPDYEMGSGSSDSGSGPDSPDGPDPMDLDCASSQELGEAPSNLQTDEFPLAAMNQPGFTPNQWPPRNTLRCIDHKDNNYAGRQYAWWRGQNSFYDRDNPNLSEADRVIASRREEACDGELVRGDWFDIAFDVTGATALPYCMSGVQRDCRPDGREFYMTEVKGQDIFQSGPQRGQPKPWASGTLKVRLNEPYNLATMNNYEVITSLQAQTQGPLDNYRVVVKRFEGSDQFEIETFRMVNNQWEGSGQYVALLAPANPSQQPPTISGRIPSIEEAEGGATTIPGGFNPHVAGRTGGLPEQLTIVRYGAALTSQIGFVYGNARAAVGPFYTFSSTDRGISKQISPLGNYCIENAAPYGTRETECFFPGW